MDSRLKDDLLHIVLRMVPILPANEIYRLVQGVAKQRVVAESQVAEAVAALHRSSELIKELEASLSERTSRLNELQAEYQRFAELAKVSEGQAKALIKTIGGELAKTATKERVVAVAINIVCGLVLFVFGVIVSEPATALWKKLIDLPKG
jgi:hypothetical protein